MPPRLAHGDDGRRRDLGSDLDGSGGDGAIDDGASVVGSELVVGKLGSLSDYDVEILYTIVSRAENDPDINILPFKALFSAYDDVLVERGISKETDRVWLRCLFKIGDKNNQDRGTIFERFEVLLANLGIELEYEDDEHQQRPHLDEVGRESPRYHGQKDRTSREISDVETPTNARGVVGFGTPTPTDRSRKRRRASFNSIYDFTATVEATGGTSKRPSSRSSVSRLQVGKSPFPTSRKGVLRGVEKAGPSKQVLDVPGSSDQRRRVSDAGDPAELARLQRKQTLEAREQALNFWHTPAMERATQTGARRIPPVSVPKTPYDDSSLDAMTSTTLGEDSPVRKVPVPSPERLRAITELPGQYFRQPAARQPSLLSPFQPSHQASRVHRVRQAQEHRAIQHDRTNLLWDAFSRWLKLTRERRKERLYTELEARVVEKRNLNVLYRALDQWVVATAEQRQRTALARRHMLRRKYFKLWREHTRTNEAQVQRFALVKPLNAWRRAYVRIWANEVTAMHVYRDNLVKRYFWTWFWSYCDASAPRFRDTKLQRKVLDCWQNTLMTAQQQMTDAEAYRDRNLKISTLRKWLRHVRTDAALEQEADEFRRRILVQRNLSAWRTETQLAPLATRVSNMVDWRIARTTSATWILRTRMARRAAEVDRLRVLRNAWTAWNDRLRCQTLEARINERLMAESMYKWVLASRFKLMKRVHERRVKEQAFSQLLSGYRGFRNQLEEREIRVEQTRSRHLKAAAWEMLSGKLQSIRQKESLALDFYRPKIEHQSLEALKKSHDHIQQMEVWARDAEFFFVMKRAVKTWQGAAAEARRLKRRDAYAQVRRKVKMNLATAALEKMRSRLQQIRQDEDQAQRAYDEKVTDLGLVVLRRWRDQVSEIQEDDEKADSLYRRYLLNQCLRRWFSKLQHVRDLEARGDEFSRMHILNISSPLWRKLRFRIFEIRSRQDMADSMFDRNQKNHIRNMIRYWREQLIPRDVPPPVPDFTRSDAIDLNPLPNTGTPGDQGSYTPTGPVPRTRDWTSFGEPFDASDWIPALEPQWSTLQQSVPGYLNTPSKRAVRARALAQTSTTPASTPLRTPFLSRLRDQVGSASASGRRPGTGNRGVALGQSRLGLGDGMTHEEEEQTIAGEDENG